MKTRAQSRSSRAKQPSAKKARTGLAPEHIPTRASRAQPIQLDEEDDDNNEDEDDDADVVDDDDDDVDADVDPEDADMKDADADECAVDRDAELLSAQSSAVAIASAQSSPPIPMEDRPSWQQCLDDPCQEYADSIYQHLRTTEMILFPDSLYMDKVQSDLTHAMRSILVDWLVEVATEYKLISQTLFLSVNYIDRFLSHVQIDRSKLQLVGITAMLVAAKYWEVRPHTCDTDRNHCAALDIGLSLMCFRSFSPPSPLCPDLASCHRGVRLYL